MFRCLWERKREDGWEEWKEWSIPFGKGAHDLGMITDECRVDTVHFNKVSYKLIEERFTCYIYKGGWCVGRASHLV